MRKFIAISLGKILPIIIFLGGGIVIAWNQATIIHIYYGMSDETSALSIDFKHAIQ